MSTYSIMKDLVSVQEELSCSTNKLITYKEKAEDLIQDISIETLDTGKEYMSDSTSRGWMHTIMHAIFINNYCKVINKQTHTDSTESLYHLHLPQDSEFAGIE